MTGAPLKIQIRGFKCKQDKGWGGTPGCLGGGVVPPCGAGTESWGVTSCVGTMSGRRNNMNMIQIRVSEYSHYPCLLYL